ncbi:MAG: hypothetical protein PW791_07155 [Neorhizobium sp.]|jgi:hypothetical protein|nr:hypothetical protein [Neorhizobium sp.]
MMNSEQNHSNSDLSSVAIDSTPITSVGAEIVLEWQRRLKSVPDDVAAILIDIALAGGALTRSEGIFDDAEDLGLVSVSMKGGGWNVGETATLTNAGRHLLGLEPLDIKKSMLRQVAGWMRGKVSAAA